MSDQSFFEFVKNNGRLKIQCPKCNESLSASSVSLFDVRHPYSGKTVSIFKKKETNLKLLLKKLEKRQKQLSAQEDKLESKKNKLEDRITKRPKRIQFITKHVNIGQIVEKVLPAHPKFRFNMLDCRALFNPIDYVSFNGYDKKGKVDSISFIEIKSGKASLQKNQKQIRDAVDSKQLKLRKY